MMIRRMLPLILIIAAAGLVAFSVVPKYQEMGELKAQIAEVNQSISVAKQADTLAMEHQETLEVITEEDKQKLDRVLPGSVDKIALMHDIRGIAAEEGVSIVKARVVEGQTEEDKQDKKEEDTAEENALYEKETLSITIEAPYRSFVAFLRTLEKSLQLIDVEYVSFKSTEEEPYLFDMDISVYKLNR